jgi:hypothetical protein
MNSCLWIAASVVATADIAWFTYAGPRMVSCKDRSIWKNRDWFGACLLNGLGCLVGWLAAYFILNRVVLNGSLHDFGIWDAVAVLVAFLGITGHLPVFILQITKWQIGMSG